MTESSKFSFQSLRIAGSNCYYNGLYTELKYPGGVSGGKSDRWGDSNYANIYIVSQKNCAFLFLSELRQLYTNLNTFWYVDVKVAVLYGV